MDALHVAALLAAFALLLLGIVRILRYRRERRIARAWADYRAAALVTESRRELRAARAAQHRAAERELGRAA